MALFDRMEAASDRAQRRLYAAEAGFEHHPLARPKGDRNAAAVADPARPVTTGIAAIYTVRSTGLNLAENRDPRSDHRPGVSAPADMIETPADAPIDVKTGDMFVRTADGARFLVASTFTDDHGRIHSTVSRMA